MHFAICLKSGSMTLMNSMGSMTSKISSSSFRNITSLGLCTFGQYLSRPRTTLSQHKHYRSYNLVKDNLTTAQTLQIMFGGILSDHITMGEIVRNCLMLDRNFNFCLESTHTHTYTHAHARTYTHTHTHNCWFKFNLPPCVAV